MSEMSGFIKIHRKITEWGWYKDPITKAVFLHLLLTANYREREYMGRKILPGQTVVGRKELAMQLGISEQSVRTALNHLKSTNEITIKSTNRFSIVTVVNWEKYQLRDDELTSKSTSQLTNNQPTTNQQLTTPKERKEYKEIKKRKRKEKREARLQEIEAEDQREIERLNRLARDTFCRSRKGETM